VRVLITGMGGELGTRVANLLEADDHIEAICGVDIEPPRRRLTRAEFHRIDPRNRIRTASVVQQFRPTAVAHLGMYEPNARSDPKAALERTASGTIAALGAAEGCGTIDRIVVRSGIEVYGRRKGSPAVPDEDAPLDPTTAWGHSLRHAEMIARETGLATGATVTMLRTAPLVGPHFPSPLGRVLRQLLVPLSPHDPSFCVLHQEDAAGAIVAALRRPFAGPVNVVGEGTTTVARAVLGGRRVPLLVWGPGWRTARAVAELTGAPIPEHVQELLRCGRLAAGERVEERIGFTPAYSTREVIDQLYAWPEVTYLTPKVAA
jgi:UDP-glucose 4-epimerase